MGVSLQSADVVSEFVLGTKRTGKGRRKIGRKKRRMRAKIRHRKVDKSYEVYLALYQAVTGDEDWKNIYRQFSPDFFDLVVVE